MATENTTKKTKKEKSVTNIDIDVSTEVDITEKKTPIKAKEVDPNQTVVVRNGFQGRLIYKSPRTGERYIWPEFGDEQEMELKELRNAKNSCKKMFINNWFMFDEDWIIDYLGVRNYYKNAIKIDEFDELFKKSASEIEKAIAKLSDGQKKSVGYRAKQLIAEGEIDSRKSIAALEEALGIELIEK